jgi:hypothetical protein
VNPWRAAWRAITRSPRSALVAVIVTLALLWTVERVMAHNYQFDASWGDKNVKLAPAPLVPARPSLPP